MNSITVNRRLCLALTVSVLALAPACELEGDELGTTAGSEAGEPIASRSLGVENEPDPEPMPDVPLPPPRVPANPLEPRRPGLATLRVHPSQVRLFLQDTVISLDATGSARPVYQGTHPGNCARPPGYRQAVRDCAEFTGARKVRCLRAAEARFPEVCEDIPTPHYSYIEWGGLIQGVRPMGPEVFDFGAIHKDTWAGHLTIMVNRIGAVLGDLNFKMWSYTTRYQQTHVAIDIDLTSPEPTAYCYRSGLLECPNAQLSGMHVNITLQVLSPTADRRGIRWATQSATFTFDDSELNWFPDWLAGDVASKIRTKVKSKLEKAFRDRQDALQARFTGAIEVLARFLDRNFRGFRYIDEVIAHEGELIIHYEP